MESKSEMTLETLEKVNGGYYTDNTISQYFDDYFTDNNGNLVTGDSEKEAKEYAQSTGAEGGW